MVEQRQLWAHTRLIRTVRPNGVSEALDIRNNNAAHKAKTTDFSDGELHPDIIDAQPGADADTRGCIEIGPGYPSSHVSRSRRSQTYGEEIASSPPQELQRPLTHDTVSSGPDEAPETLNQSDANKAGGAEEDDLLNKPEATAAKRQSRDLTDAELKTLHQRVRLEAEEERAALGMGHGERDSETQDPDELRGDRVRPSRESEGNGLEVDMMLERLRKHQELLFVERPPIVDDDLERLRARFRKRET